MGLQTYPMIGFDPTQITEILDIAPDHMYVILLCVNKQTKPPQPRTMRYNIGDIMHLNKFQKTPLEKT